MTAWRYSKLRRWFLRWRRQEAENSLRIAIDVAKRTVEKRAAELADLRNELDKIDPESAADRVRAAEKSAKRALLMGGVR